MGFYFFDRKKVNKKLFAKNKLDGVSIHLSALITHFGGVLTEEFTLMILLGFLTPKFDFLA